MHSECIVINSNHIEYYIYVSIPYEIYHWKSEEKNSLKSLSHLCLKFSISEILALILYKFITRYQHYSALEKVTLFYFVQKSFSIYHIEFTKNVK